MGSRSHCARDWCRSLNSPADPARRGAGPPRPRGPSNRCVGSSLSTRPAWPVDPRRREEDLRLPDGGGHRTRGRGYEGEASRKRQVGYRFIHTALDDQTRLVYSEILDTEQGATAANFWHRAAAWFAAHGVACERVITDNGACYKSGLWHRACAATATKVKKTRPRRPQTNGKVERYHRTLLEEWAASVMQNGLPW